MRVLVFDSGIGGVGIAREVRRAVPWASVVYLRDDAGFPYGLRNDADLVARVLAVVGAGIARIRPDLVVVACNTASTVALAALRRAYDVGFVGCVPPVKPAAALSRTGIIGVLATPATVRGPYLQALCAREAPGCRVLVHGAAGLAALAEARFAGVGVARAEVAAELDGLLCQAGSDQVDAVALGCTHYAWLLPDLRACLPGHVAWLDPAAPVAGQVLRLAAAFGREGDMADDGLVLGTGKASLAGAAWQEAGFARLARLAVTGQVVGPWP